EELGFCAMRHARKRRAEYVGDGYPHGSDAMIVALTCEDIHVRWVGAVGRDSRSRHSARGCITVIGESINSALLALATIERDLSDAVVLEPLLCLLVGGLDVGFERIARIAQNAVCRCLYRWVNSACA